MSACLSDFFWSSPLASARLPLQLRPYVVQGFGYNEYFPNVLQIKESMKKVVRGMVLDPRGFVHVAEDGIARSYACKLSRDLHFRHIERLTSEPSSQRHRLRLCTAIECAAQQHDQQPAHGRRCGERTSRRDLRRCQRFRGEGFAPDLPSFYTVASCH